MPHLGLSRPKSEQLFKEAKEMFPGGVHSPVRAFKSVEGAPLFIDYGHGPYLEDVDGHRFVDFCCSWGPLLLGHNHAAIRTAVAEAIQKGMSFGAPSKIGNDLGKFILDRHRYIDKLRFVSSGTEAVTSAIRLARGFTGRSKVIKFEGCYHGHVDSLMVKAGSGLATLGTSTSAGIPSSVIQDTLVLTLGDVEGLKNTFSKYKNEIACIIIEPIPANNGLLLQESCFLQFLREITKEHKSLLIFDEVISGFRVGMEGAAGLYGIDPDIITFGKIIGGGMPVGAYAGKAEIMSHVAPDGDVYQAGTLSANPITMTAGLAALKYAEQYDVYSVLEKRTHNFVSRINALLREKNDPAHVIHIGSIFWIQWSQDRITTPTQIDARGNEYFKQLHRLLLQAGVYLGPSTYEVGFVSYAHDELLLWNTAEIIAEALCAIELN